MNKVERVRQVEEHDFAFIDRLQGNESFIAADGRTIACVKCVVVQSVAWTL